MDYKSILRMAERMYHVVPLMVAEGDHMEHNCEAVKKSWRNAIGERSLFSSRRRNTRCVSDWSSDVCSSDLSILEVWARLPWQRRQSCEPVCLRTVQWS